MINLHLWFHTILLMALSVSPSNMVHGQKSTAQPKRDSADVIREIVDACELLTPTPCLDLPLICQPLYTAAMVYLKCEQTSRERSLISSLARRAEQWPRELSRLGSTPTPCSLSSSRICSTRDLLDGRAFHRGDTGSASKRECECRLFGCRRIEGVGGHVSLVITGQVQLKHQHVVSGALHNTASQ